MHIKGGEGRRSSDLTISVIGMCVREVDIEEGKGRGREVGERRGEEKGRVGSGEEGRRRGERRGREEREREHREQYGWNKSLQSREKRIHSSRLKLN